MDSLTQGSGGLAALRHAELGSASMASARWIGLSQFISRKGQRREEAVLTAKRLFSFIVAASCAIERIWGLSARSFFFAPLPFA
jgi:hypothetical protein